MAELREQGYKAFYVAIGCQGGAPRRRARRGRRRASTTAVDFLRTVARVTRRSRWSGKTVVIGGGNVAIDVAP